MPVKILRAKVEKNKLIFNDDDELSLYLHKYENKPVEVIIRNLSSQRSNRQNRYYWTYLKIIEEDTGNDCNDMHEYFKRVFLPPKFIKVFNKEIKIPNSTTKLDKLEFADYISKIENMTGIPTPDQNIIYLE